MGLMKWNVPLKDSTLIATYENVLNNPGLRKEKDFIQ